MILLDTSGLLGALDSSQRQRAQATAALRHARGPLLLSPFVLAELDYLLATRVSRWPKWRAVPTDSNRSTPPTSPSRTRSSRPTAISTDASIVVLSRRYETLDVLTLDERHFRTIRGSTGRPFRVLPADAPT